MQRFGSLTLLTVATATVLLPLALLAADTPDGLRSDDPIPLMPYGDVAGSDDYLGAAANGQGGFAMVWIRNAGLPTGNVYARLFNSQARPLGPAIQVNAISGNQQFSAVAGNARGQFVVTWETFGPAGGVLYAQRFAPGGAKDGVPLTISGQAARIDQESVGIDAAGNFLVAWDEPGSGITQPVDDPDAAFPAVAVQPGGSFALAWRTPGASGLTPVMGQRFDASGEALGEAFEVGDNAFYEISATATAGGGFAFAWVDGVCVTPSAGACDVKARFFGRGGQPSGAAVEVASPLATSLQPAIAADGRGRVGIGWQNCADDQVPDQPCPLVAAVYSARGTLVLAPSEVPGDLQLNGPVLTATPGGFLAAADRYSPGQEPWGIYGWPLTVR
jgi:hypothetical protein